MRYKIIYHVGEELTVKTKVQGGTLILENDKMVISGSVALTIPFAEVRDVEMLRLHGLGRMIKVTCQQRIIFLTVVRLNLFGFFVIVNFFRAGELYEILKQKIQKFSE